MNIDINKLLEMKEGFIPCYFDDELPAIGHNKPPPSLPAIEHESIISQFQDMGDLLNGLDDMFLNIKKLKPTSSRHAQKIAKQFGPYVVDMTGTGDDIKYVNEGIGHNFLEQGFQAYGLPAFLIGYWHRNADTDKVKEFFVCVKIKDLHPFFKKKNHAYYQVTRLLLGESIKRPIELLFYIEVNEKTGEVKALRTVQNKTKYIPAKKAKLKGGNRIVPDKSWDFPDYRDHENESQMEETPEEYLATCFCLEYNIIMRRELGINIIAKKNGYRATFTVPQNQWKTFFKNRINVRTETGRSKPIFHAVISHIRETKVGAVPVKTHYRGLRSFNWKGYELKIIIPGKHAAAQSSFDVSAVLADDDEPVLIDVDQLSDRINQVFEGGKAK